MLGKTPQFFCSAAAVLALTLTACASDPIRLYPGPELPRDRIAILEQSHRTAVLAVDGVQTYGTAWSLLPGWHEIWLVASLRTKVLNIAGKGQSYCRLKFEALPGGVYKAVAEVRAKFSHDVGTDTNRTIEIKITDARGELQAYPEECLPTPPTFQD